MEPKKAILSDLPRELIQQISQSLPVECLKNLRLVNKHMSVAVLGPSFHRFFVRQTTNLSPSSLSSLELLLQNNAFGQHVRHVRVMAETFAIASAENTLATGLHHPAESVLTNRHGDDFVVQLDGPMIRGTREKLREIAASLEWMKAHVKTHEMIVATEEGEEEVANRLASIFRWMINFPLETIEVDARFVNGPGLFSRPVARDIVESDRQRLWARASQVYRLTMTAVARSGAPVPNLRIFSATTGCSVPSYDVTLGLAGLLDAGLPRSLVSVKNLAFSLSTRVDHGWERLGQVYGPAVAKAEKRRQRLQWNQIWDEIPWEDMHGVGATEEDTDYNTDDSDWDSDPEHDAEIAAEKGSEIRGRYGDSMPQSLCRGNFPGVALLLQHMLNLETLDLHMYQTLEYEAYDGGSRLHHYAAVFTHIVDGGLHFQQLKNLTLRGLCVRADDLLTFMERHPRIESLELYHVMLATPVSHAPWNAVLTKLCRDAARRGSSLSSIFCSNLYNTTRVSHNEQWRHAHNFLRRHEALKSEWIERWWVRCRAGAPVLTTRRVLRDEFEREDAFGGGKTTERWTSSTKIPGDELQALHWDRYGRTYG
jgi:hypothetical protein